MACCACWHCSCELLLMLCNMGWCFSSDWGGAGCSFHCSCNNTFNSSMVSDFCYAGLARVCRCLCLHSRNCFYDPKLCAGPLQIASGCLSVSLERKIEYTTPTKVFGRVCKAFVWNQFLCPLDLTMGHTTHCYDFYFCNLFDWRYFIWDIERSDCKNSIRCRARLYK